MVIIMKGTMYFHIYDKTSNERFQTVDKRNFVNSLFILKKSGIINM